ncbi:MAG TPA: A/G-specific adenine glycosylase [Flavisolibacter sp.]
MKKQRIEKERIRNEQRGADFARDLLHWNRYENNRSMPWKGEKDPYRIWLSEVILQQTRVEQGLRYYQNFIRTFPNVHALASAPEEKVFKLWEGLGYYSRCRNLLHSAKHISEKLGGHFPQRYEDILALKGVGAYTAAAIASFAYNLPYAVLDGNVFRVLSRIFDKEVPVDSTRGKKEFTALAQAVLPSQKAGEYNQAIMDFGATICKPLPLCEACFFNHGCLAYLLGRQQLLPVKEKKATLKKRWLNYFFVQCGYELLIQQRMGKDIWQGLHQAFLIETEKSFSTPALQQLFMQQTGITNYTIVADWKNKQALSHQSICFHLLHVRVTRKKKIEGYKWIHRDELRQLAFPRTLQHTIEGLFTPS